ncbi:hypothetical protein COL40_26875 [Bacillus toyonensis]|nr:hypothetical protein CON95_25985 [Bacillus toyonensis]PFX81977.1 hypothetical protein COL40_26875 [Bacillus toyonensis]PHC19404.1 hypothetical protein COE97_01190 [Bacillus toyonensis]
MMFTSILKFVTFNTIIHLNKKIFKRDYPKEELGKLLSIRGIVSISEKNHAKQKINCPYGQLIYIILVNGSQCIYKSTVIHF